MLVWGWLNLVLCCCRDALMYVQAVGWQLARKDKIDLDSDTLHQKQGLYTCPPTTDGQKPFHCCLQVQEEPINVRRSVMHVIMQGRMPGCMPTRRVQVLDVRRKGPETMRWSSQLSASNT
jgi:hypothetical protein